MAEQEKSNYTKIVAAMAILSITLVMVLKDRETEHLEMSNTSIEENASALHGATRYKNVMVE